MRNAFVTADGYRVITVVCVHAKDMKEPWCLAANTTTDTAKQLMTTYGKRWGIEAAFRDTKDLRFGMGMASIRVSTPERRDRLWLLNAFAVVLLTLLGAAGEALGYDRHLKSNTSKKRTHSLFPPRAMLYELIPMMPEPRLRPLVERFALDPAPNPRVYWCLRGHLKMRGFMRFAAAHPHWPSLASQTRLRRARHSQVHICAWRHSWCHSTSLSGGSDRRNIAAKAPRPRNVQGLRAKHCSHTFVGVSKAMTTDVSLGTICLRSQGGPAAIRKCETDAGMPALPSALSLPVGTCPNFANGGN